MSIGFLFIKIQPEPIHMCIMLVHPILTLSHSKSPLYFPGCFGYHFQSGTRILRPPKQSGQTGIHDSVLHSFPAVDKCTTLDGSLTLLRFTPTHPSDVIVKREVNHLLPTPSFSYLILQTGSFIRSRHH